MSLDQQLRYYEERVKEGEKAHSEAAPGIKQHVYESKVSPYKAILRQVRLKAGLLICWGDVGCDAYPDSKCAGGQHETCEEHTHSCFLCVRQST